MPALRDSADDACPGALRLHAAADGPLARIRLPGGMLTGAQLAVLADLAARHGDGALELTSRANIQLRAVRADPEELAMRLAAAGLLPSVAHETVRNIAAPPLADQQTRTLVAALDESLCADPGLAALPGRFLFSVGSSPLAADVAAVPEADTPERGDPGRAAPKRWAVLLAGRDAGIRVEADQVVATLLASAHAFLAEQTGRSPQPWRLHEIPDGPTLVARRLAANESGASHDSGTQRAACDPAADEGPLAGVLDSSPAGVLDSSPVGVLDGPLPGLTAVGALVPLGRLVGVPLGVLARADRLAVTTWGGVVVLDLAPEAADRWVRELSAAGLATEAGSKWAGMTACAGRPGCGKALADVRRDAEVAARFVDGLPVHWVGCARGCGSPAGEHVRVEATAEGYLVAGVPVGDGDLAEVVAAGRA